MARRPPPPQKSSPRGGLNGLLSLGVLATLAFVILRFVSGGLSMDVAFANPLSLQAALTYFALFVFAATPIALWYALMRSAIRRTAWDHAFFIGAVCSYLYLMMVVGFAVIVSMSLFATCPATHPAFSGLLCSMQGAVVNDTLFLGVFWLAVFTPPIIFMNGPISDAARAEKHGMGASGGINYIGFAMALAASVYVMQKLAGASSNILVMFTTVIAGIMVGFSVLAILVFGRQYRDLLTWIMVAAGAVAIVTTVASFFGL